MMIGSVNNSYAACCHFVFFLVHIKLTHLHTSPPQKLFCTPFIYMIDCVYLGVHVCVLVNLLGDSNNYDNYDMESESGSEYDHQPTRTNLSHVWLFCFIKST